MNYPLKELLKTAQAERFAVPAFNCSDCWELLGVLEAAREARAPVIIQTISQVVATWSFPFLEVIGAFLASDSKTSVYLHLDHAREVDACVNAIGHGYQSVMFDGSHLPVAENAALCTQVAAHALPKEVCLEGEVGHIRGSNAEGIYMGEDFLACVEDAVYMEKNACLNALAVGIGNQHGFYQGTPNLNLKRLKEIHEAVALPLVLHGGSGIPDETVRAAVAAGICKVNVGTQLHYAYLKAADTAMQENRSFSNVISIMQSTVPAVKAQAAHWISLCMAAGKA